MATSPEQESRYNVRSVDRALSILLTLADGKRRSLTELSEDIGISTSTTFRLLASLAQYRFVDREEESGRYRLGIACLELARAYQAGDTIRHAAMPELEALRDRTWETVHLAVLDNMEIVYLDKVQGLHAIGLMSSRVGSRAPAYCTGVGKAMLAHADPQFVRQHFQRVGLKRFTDTTIDSVDVLIEHLALVRECGYALDNGEHEGEVRCVAAPIFDRSGRVIAAISVSGPKGRMEPLESNTELINSVLQAVGRISATLGYRAAEARSVAVLGPALPAEPTGLAAAEATPPSTR